MDWKSRLPAKTSSRWAIDKMSLIADIEAIQSLLAKPQPNRSIVSAAWCAIKRAAVISEWATLGDRVAGYIALLLATWATPDALAETPSKHPRHEREVAGCAWLSSQIWRDFEART
jgi:hypothetical protein